MKKLDMIVIKGKTCKVFLYGTKCLLMGIYCERIWKMQNFEDSSQQNSYEKLVGTYVKPSEKWIFYKSGNNLCWKVE